jgi:hypothetical protein
LFFLQGARLSRAAILNGITCWRLHVPIAATTFVLFPLFYFRLSTHRVTSIRGDEDAHPLVFGRFGPPTQPANCPN